MTPARSFPVSWEQLSPSLGYLRRLTRRQETRPTATAPQQNRPGPREKSAAQRPRRGAGPGAPGPEAACGPAAAPPPAAARQQPRQETGRAGTSPPARKPPGGPPHAQGGTNGAQGRGAETGATGGGKGGPKGRAGRAAATRRAARPFTHGARHGAPGGGRQVRKKGQTGGPPTREHPKHSTARRPRPAHLSGFGPAAQQGPNRDGWGPLAAPGPGPAGASSLC